MLVPTYTAKYKESDVRSGFVDTNGKIIFPDFNPILDEGKVLSIKNGKIGWGDATMPPMFPIQWDGNTSGRDIGTMTFDGSPEPLKAYKVSARVLKRDDIIGAVITLSNNQTVELTEETTADGNEGWVMISDDYCALSGEYMFSAKAGVYNFDDFAEIIIPSDGLYFVSNGVVYVSSLDKT